MECTSGICTDKNNINNMEETPEKVVETPEQQNDKVSKQFDANFKKLVALLGGDKALNALTDAQEFVNRLERKIADLNLTRTVTNQSKAQIRLIQNTNHTLAEKINSSITSAAVTDLFKVIS